jgi:phosphopantothenoylcysteine decarboxylase/phosphopantothenate--cysteine ligase
VAKAAAARGAQVTLISANVSLADLPGVEMIKVETAADLMKSLDSNFDAADIVIMAAAVADARPSQLRDTKIKKGEFSAISLTQNPDVLATVTARKSSQVVIAFAAETSPNLEEAKEKLKRKGADLIYLNDVSHGDIFNSDTTQGFIIDKAGNVREVAKTTKETLADELLTSALHQLS